jgi:hypothetical protein
VEGHFQALLSVLRSQPWQVFWNDLNLLIPTFADLSLRPNDPDLLVWQTCQRDQLILVTGNRNASGPESLEVVIQTLNQVDSLPVITLATPDRILNERSHAERAGVRILDILLEIDHYRGAGRLYVP